MISPLQMELFHLTYNWCFGPTLYCLEKIHLTWSLTKNVPNISIEFLGSVQDVQPLNTEHVTMGVKTNQKLRKYDWKTFGGYFEYVCLVHDKF